MTNRVVDYCGFAVRFVGIGYLVLWPLATPDPFGLARGCAPRAPSWNLLCHWPQLLHLTPGLHLIGAFCAGALAVHLLLRAFARWRRARTLRAHAALAASARLPAALSRRPQHSPLRTPLPTVKPRSQFGLRRDPRAARDSGVDSPPSKSKTPAEPI